MKEAIQHYERLLEKGMAAGPDVEHDLRDAYALSLLYEDLGRLHRADAAPDRADGVDAKRRATWTQWNVARPGNSFVLRQLAAVETGGASASRPATATVRGPAPAAR